MPKQTLDQLKQGAILIKNETIEEAITPERVGGLLLDIVDTFGIPSDNTFITGVITKSSDLDKLKVGDYACSIIGYGQLPSENFRVSANQSADDNTNYIQVAYVYVEETVLVYTRGTIGDGWTYWKLVAESKEDILDSAFLSRGLVTTSGSLHNKIPAGNYSVNISKGTVLGLTSFNMSHIYTNVLDTNAIQIIQTFTGKKYERYINYSTEDVGEWIDLSAGNGSAGGIQVVDHDNSLTGDGTSANPLKVTTDTVILGVFKSGIFNYIAEFNDSKPGSYSVHLIGDERFFGYKTVNFICEYIADSSQKEVLQTVKTNDGRHFQRFGNYSTGIYTPWQELINQNYQYFETTDSNYNINIGHKTGSKVFINTKTLVSNISLDSSLDFDKSIELVIAGGNSVKIQGEFYKSGDTIFLFYNKNTNKWIVSSLFTNKLKAVYHVKYALDEGETEDGDSLLYRNLVNIDQPIFDAIVIGDYILLKNHLEWNGIHQVVAKIENKLRIVKQTENNDTYTVFVSEGPNVGIWQPRYNAIDNSLIFLDIAAHELLSKYIATNNPTVKIIPDFFYDIYNVTESGAGNISVGVYKNLPTKTACKTVFVKNSRTTTFQMTFATTDIVVGGVTYKFKFPNGHIISLSPNAEVELNYLFQQRNVTTIECNIKYNIAAT